MKILTKSELQRIQLETQRLERALAEGKNQLSAMRRSAEQSVEAANAQLAALQAQLQAQQLQSQTTQDQQHAELQAIQAQLAQAHAQQATTAQALEHTREQLSQTQTHCTQLQSRLDESLRAGEALKQQSEQQLQATRAQLQQEQQSRQSANEKLTQAEQQLVQAMQQRQALEQELAQQQQTAQQAQQREQQTEQSLKALKQTSEQARQDLAASQKKFTQLQAQHDDNVQENELLLLQLMQAQEELVEYYEQKNNFEKLYLAYKARWDRLEQRQPQYVDFGVIEVASYDPISEVPSITWRLKDFAQGDTVIPEFLFATVIDQGHPGIALVQSLDQPIAPVVPMRLQQDPAQMQQLMSYSSSAYRQLQAGAHVLALLEAGQWKGFAWPEGLDPAFWRPTLRALGVQVRSLPAVLRYEQVRLKRELLNPDYEHLWLEFTDLTLASKRLRKFEVRLGASHVQPGGFSKFPKFELPLIDGKHKPFDSWYAESQDEHGSKLELRFSIENQRFDLAVFTKLSKEDQVFVLQLVQTMPQALAALERQQVAIHRPWSTWRDFAQAALNVVKALQSAAAQQSKPEPAAADPAPLAAVTPSAAPAATPSPAITASAATPPAQVAQVIRVAPKTGPKTKSASRKPAAAKSARAKALT